MNILQEVLLEKNTNFFIGSGASVPYFSFLGDIENILSGEILAKEGKDLLKIKFFCDSILGNKLLTDCLNGIKDLEDTNYNEMRLVLQNYKWFIHNSVEYMKKRNSRISPRRNTIFTTNYDMYFEVAIEEYMMENNRLFFNDGANGYIKRILNADNFNRTVSSSGVFDNYYNEIPNINLIKCHGSVNWITTKTQDRDRIRILNEVSAINKLNEMYKGLESENVGNWIDESSPIDVDLSEIMDIIGDKKIEEINYQVNCFGKKNSMILNEMVNQIEEMQIVMPTKEKFFSTTLKEHYYSMLRLLSYELEKEQTGLICFGFSFADEHIRSIVERSLNNPNLILIIMCYSELSKNDIISKFSFSENQVPYNIIFISPNDFIIRKYSLEEFKSLTKDTPKKVIEAGEEIIVFDEVITIKSENEPVIDFEGFNKILEKGIDNLFSDNLVVNESR